MRIQIIAIILISSFSLVAQQFQWNTMATQPKTPVGVDETQMDETGSALFYADYLQQLIDSTLQK